jgi:hypothetical protein
MAAPITARKRSAILKAIKAGGSSRAQIARDHKVSGSTVSKIAKEAGIEAPFDRAHTKNATQARTVDMAARRAELAELLLGDAFKLRDRVWDKYQVVSFGPDGPEIAYLNLPPAKDTQCLMASVGIAIDKHLVITKHDADPGTDSAKSMLADLGRALGVAAEALSEPSSDKPDVG